MIQLDQIDNYTVYVLREYDTIGSNWLTTLYMYWENMIQLDQIDNYTAYVLREYDTIRSNWSLHCIYIEWIWYNWIKLIITLYMYWENIVQFDQIDHYTVYV